MVCNELDRNRMCLFCATALCIFFKRSNNKVVIIINLGVFIIYLFLSGLQHLLTIFRVTETCVSVTALSVDQDVRSPDCPYLTLYIACTIIYLKLDFVFEYLLSLLSILGLLCGLYSVCHHFFT